MALGVPMAEVWGMTETGGISTYTPMEKIRPGRIGIAAPYNEVRIDEATGEILLEEFLKPMGITQVRLAKEIAYWDNRAAVLADLPGYGYAAVPQDAKLRWQRVMANYLVTRQNLVGVVLLCDPRLGLTELDEALLDVIRPRVQQGLKFLILLTKTDKLTHAEAQKALSIARLQCAGGEARLFSALKKQGLDDVARLLWQWTRPSSDADTQPASGG